MFTMFTSSKKEKVLKGQKQYYLSNNEPKPCRTNREGSNVDSKTDLSKYKKFSADLSDFG